MMCACGTRSWSRPKAVGELRSPRRLSGVGSAYVVSSSELERTRVRVTKAIRRTIAAIDEVSPGLGEHLTASVDTGRRCLYRPQDGLPWRVEREP
jgi:hypothetical protein